MKVIIDDAVINRSIDFSHFVEEFKEKFIGCMYTQDILIHMRYFVENRLGSDIKFYIQYDDINHTIFIRPI